MKQFFTRRNVYITLAIVAGLLVLFIVIAVIILFRSNNRDKAQEQSSSQTSQTSSSSSTSSAITSVISSTSSDVVTWQLTGTGWQAIGTPPVCPDPLEFEFPTDISNVTSILYPGQTRGGNYKPHGGMRFDTIQNNTVDVRVPMDAQVVNGGRYLVDGEIQYTFDFINSCGIMYRLGHLRELTPTFEDLVVQLPEATEGDSRTTNFNPAISVNEGDLIATKVGLINESNTFFDWGVYDLRKKNESSKSAEWAAGHPEDLAQRALCWFDLLSASDEAVVRSLPAGDPGSGKNSDYCD